MSDTNETEAAIRAYAPMVYRLCYAQTRCKSDADDVFQEVFLRYVRAKPRFQSEEHRKAWLLRVSVNCLKKHAASAWMRKTVPLDEALPSPQPEESGLAEALGTLPQRYLAAVHLYYYEGLSTEQIAGILGVRPSAVRTRLTRARRMLQEILKEEA